MTESLARLLLQLSESGDPAILWGRQARPFLGRAFDRLLDGGLLIEQSPAEEWPVCANCACEAGSRMVQYISGQPVASCPVDARSDTALQENDLRSFRIVRSALVRVIAKAFGFEKEPSEVAAGLWKIGRTTGGHAIYVTLDHAALLLPGIIHAIRTVDPTGSVSIIGPELETADQVRFKESAIRLVAFGDVLSDDRDGYLTGNPATLIDSAASIRLVLRVGARSGQLDGVALALSDQTFRLLRALAERVVSSMPFMSARDIEDTIYDSAVHLTNRPGRDIVRELREDFRKAGVAKSVIDGLLRNERSKGWRLALEAAEVSVLA